MDKERIVAQNRFCGMEKTTFVLLTLQNDLQISGARATFEKCPHC
jgi:hypothetical protein